MKQPLGAATTAISISMCAPSSTTVLRASTFLTIRPDGSGLTMHPHTAGHPEWESGRRVIGAEGPRQVIYDVIDRRVVETLGSPEAFPQPGDDIALSPDGQWFVNGHSDAGNNYYTVLRRADGSWARTAAILAANSPAANCASTARRPGTAPVTRSCSRTRSVRRDAADLREPGAPSQVVRRRGIRDSIAR